MPFDVNDDSVPSIGRPGDVMGWYPTALVRCRCVQPPSLQIVVVTGIAAPTTCVACGTTYLITGMMPDGKGGLKILVDFIRKVTEENKGQVM